MISNTVNNINNNTISSTSNNIINNIITDDKLNKFKNEVLKWFQAITVRNKSRTTFGLLCGIAMNNNLLDFFTKYNLEYTFKPALIKMISWYAYNENKDWDKTLQCNMIECKQNEKIIFDEHQDKLDKNDISYTYKEPLYFNND